MKINYNNTALKILEDTKNFNFYLPEDTTPKFKEGKEREFGESVLSAFEKSGLKINFKNNIQYVTQPFYQAYIKSQAKIKQIVLQEKFEEAGTLIIPWPHHTQTIFYYIKTNGEQGDNWDYEVLIAMFTKGKHSNLFGLDLFVSAGVNKEGNRDYKDFIWNGFKNEGRDVTWWIAELIMFKTFLRYADVETKIVNKQRKEHHCGEKYVNETNRRVEILDSTYFTTISRTEGFGVSGHFRWQPYGEGMSKKRLQWISEYQKHGYTRRAKIVREGIQ